MRCRMFIHYEFAQRAEELGKFWERFIIVVVFYSFFLSVPAGSKKRVSSFWRCSIASFQLLLLLLLLLIILLLLLLLLLLHT